MDKPGGGIAGRPPRNLSHVLQVDQSPRSGHCHRAGWLGKSGTRSEYAGLGEVRSRAARRGDPRGADRADAIERRLHPAKLRGGRKVARDRDVARRLAGAAAGNCLRLVLIRLHQNHHLRGGNLSANRFRVLAKFRQFLLHLRDSIFQFREPLLGCLTEEPRDPFEQQQRVPGLGRKPLEAIEPLHAGDLLGADCPGQPQQPRQRRRVGPLGQHELHHRQDDDRDIQPALLGELEGLRVNGRLEHELRGKRDPDHGDADVQCQLQGRVALYLIALNVFEDQDRQDQEGEYEHRPAEDEVDALEEFLPGFPPAHPRDPDQPRPRIHEGHSPRRHEDHQDRPPDHRAARLGSIAAIDLPDRFRDEHRPE